MTDIDDLKRLLDGLARLESKINDLAGLPQKVEELEIAVRDLKDALTDEFDKLKRRMKS